jgi:hypothetical protein
MGTNKDRTAGNRTTVRLSNGYALSSHVNAVATVWWVRVLFLVQQLGMPVATVAMPAAFGVSGWFQVTGFDSFHRFFLCHFIFLSRWFGLP